MRTPLLALIMAALGFGLVYYWDAAGKKRPPRELPVLSVPSIDDAGPTLSDLYHKLVDRFLDRDMPTKKKKGMPLLPKAKKTVAQKPAAPTKRAEEKPPTHYRQQSEGLPVAKMRREKKKRNQRQRIDAILDTVGVQ